MTTAEPRPRDPTLSTARPTRRKEAAVENRVPQHDLDAEAAVLSCMMNLHDRDPVKHAAGVAVFARVAAMLRPEHFYSEAHRQTYAACLAVAAAGRHVDLVNVKTQLRDAGRLAQVDDRGYLTTINNAAPSLTGAESYAETVRAKWIIRRRTELSQKLVGLGYGASEPALAGAIVAELAALQASAQDGSEPTKPAARVLDTAAMGAAAVGPVPRRWHPAPRLARDDLRDGFEPQDLGGARPAARSRQG